MKNQSEIIKNDINEIIEDIGEDLRLLEGKTLVVTGASGMIPAYFLETVYSLNKIFENPCKVIAYIHNSIDVDCRLGYLLDNRNFKFISGDINKTLDLSYEIDYLIHAASKASPKYYMHEPIDTIMTNVLPTIKILENMRENQNVKCFLFFSSSTVYGQPDTVNIPTPETYEGCENHLGLRACYSEAKRFCETLIYNYVNKYNLDAKIIRVFHVFGPGMKKDDGRVWSDFINSVIKGNEINLLSDGLASRNFCYVSDGIKQIWQVLFKGKSGEAYNIGSSNCYITIRELAEIVRDVVDKDAKINILNSLPLHIKESPTRCNPDMSKTLSLLNLYKETDIRTGIYRTYKWILEEYYNC